MRAEVLKEKHSPHNNKISCFYFKMLLNSFKFLNWLRDIETVL